MEIQEAGLEEVEGVLEEKRGGPGNTGGKAGRGRGGCWKRREGPGKRVE